MAAIITLRNAGFLLFLTLAVAASSTAGQRPVAASDADLGDAWRPAPAFDATRPQAGLAVDVRFDVLRRAAATGGVLSLPMPDGTALRFSVKWAQSDAAQTLVAGPAVGDDGEASLTVVGETMAGRLVVNGRLFVVRRIPGSNAHLVTEVEQASQRPLAQPLSPPAQSEPAKALAPDAPQDTNQFVDVMVVYTPASRAQSGSTAAIVAELTAAINSSNVALANSAVTHRFRLVHHQEIAYTEDGVGDTSLRRVTNPADGFMDDVPVLRNQYRADLVALFTTDVDVCGIGWLMGPSNVNTAFENMGYSVTVWDCANSILALPHEMGHNMGLHHDRAWAVGYGLPAFPYAYGWFVNGVGHDIMSYPFNCSGFCPTRTIFSTPLFNFPGTGVPAGTVNDDTARALNGTSTAVANFRQSVCTYSVGPLSASFPSGGGTGSVTVNPADRFCPWTASAGTGSPLTVTTGSTGTGNGVVTYAVAPNPGPGSRTATLTIGQQTVTIFQAGRNNLGDVDGDGRSELAIYRPSSGSWYLLRSGTDFTGGAGYSWGASIDLPVIGDFDGDGRTDLAVVFRPSTGHWFILKSSTNYTTWITYQWGTAGDMPVPGDYDGDGRTDLAVYRPSNGTWYILTSEHGLHRDVPTRGA